MKKVILTVFLAAQLLPANKILIPMDLSQKDHLKAYGIAYWVLTQDVNVEWLLNYRGGSFMIDNYSNIEQECRIRGVTVQIISDGDAVNIYGEIDLNNMEVILLEKTPKIAIYTPPNKQPWDDAVTMALTYAEVNMRRFGMRMSCWGSWRNMTGSISITKTSPGSTVSSTATTTTPRGINFSKLSPKQWRTVWASLRSRKRRKRSLGRSEITLALADFFSPCAPPQIHGISLLRQKGVDIVESVFDSSPAEPNTQLLLKYENSLAFENFTLITDPFVYEFSDIDFPPSNNPVLRSAEADYFTLFEFSAKYDPVPSMLTQDHVGVVSGFMGQTTGFRRDLIKKHVVIMGEVEDGQQVKIHPR